jgi:hypothetical protein
MEAVVFSKGTPKGRHQEVEKRFHENVEKMVHYLNFEVLTPLLCEAAVLSLEEGQALYSQTVTNVDKTALLSQKLTQTPSLCSTLLDCLKKEKDHLGHAYITALLEGRQYASEEEIAYSQSLRDAIVKSLTDFTKGIDFNTLVPHMFERQLVTDYERKYVSDTQHSINKRTMFLLTTIDTKGPTGYKRFASCLEHEHSHRTHTELYTRICEDATLSQRLTSLSRRPSIPENETTLPKKISDRSLRLHGALKGKEYEKLMTTFQSFHHNGEWVKLEAEAKNYLEKKDICLELQVVVLLESAVGSIFQQKEEETVSLVSKAQQLCKQIPGDNSTFLKGRCMYILSRLYRYLKQVEKAKEYAENAKKILFIAEAGEDSAFAKYCYACVLVESEASDNQEIEDYFNFAIFDANSHTSGLDLVAPHSYMRLAQMYLGSQQYTAGRVRDRSSIHKAESCLRKVDLNTLSLRSGCHFHLIKSDLYHSKGMITESKKVAQVVLDTSEKHNFTNEIESATNRLQALCC